MCLYLTLTISFLFNLRSYNVVKLHRMNIQINSELFSSVAKFLDIQLHFVRFVKRI